MTSAAGPLGSKFSHVDLVVSDLERSLAFYAGLLEPLGWTRIGEILGEAGKRDVASREVVDERAAWLRDRGAEVESGPREYDYTPGYYAAFFFDPDGIKLELLHRPVE